MIQQAWYLQFDREGKGQKKSTAEIYGLKS
jgi:hypothetical protein